MSPAKQLTAPSDPNRPYILVCHSAQDEEAVVDLTSRVQPLVNNVYGVASDFRWYKEIAGSDQLEPALDALIKGATIGWILLSPDFLYSAACLRELKHFSDTGGLTLTLIRRLPLDDPAAYVEGVTGRVIRPWGYKPYSACETTDQKDQFAIIVAQDLVNRWRKVAGDA
ncbi:MAG: toll/interleukin-1 receptor domain-containing protein [Bifidobacteriaceae bacterium]|jgi:hypothetical protein|nr:toll/interleukin-1 receptor domain-containing protein [Bifidobacteriaceae bacterium]